MEQQSIQLPEIYQDAYLIAVHKPVGLLVHRTSISEDSIFALQIVRDQVNQKVFPVHRLDRGTSGLLLFAKSSEAASFIGKQFMQHEIEKKYLAIIRGYIEQSGIIEYELSNSKGKNPSLAVTNYEKISEVEQNFAVNRYPTSRYSFIEMMPKTGKWHQLRRHFAHIRHPIIGDKRHGDCKHNKYFSENFNLHRMWLHASEMSFVHPYSRNKITLKCPISENFEKTLQFLSLK